MKLLIERWRKYVEEECEEDEDGINERDYQKESEKVTDHERNKDELLGDGGQENKAPYEDEPIKPRSKSAPPAAG